MPAARLTQIRLRNFKSIGPEQQTVDLKALTILIGRNNSGKSTVIQGLLLLKQTLEDPRPEVQLALQGNYLRATSLRELTHGSPEDMKGKGPEIALVCTPGKDWPVTISARLAFSESASAIIAETVTLEVAPPLDRDGPQENAWSWCGSTQPMDHFLPRFELAASTPREAWPRMVAQELRWQLTNFAYVGAARSDIPPYYARPTNIPGRTMLPNGDSALELLYGRRADVVHLAEMLEPGDGRGAVGLSDRITSSSLKEAVDNVLRALGLDAGLSFAEVQELGLFRVYFGRAPLNQVGRGVAHLLPVIIAGLVADPLLGQKEVNGEESVSAYLDRCDYYPTLALEELESRLHPKAQSRLAEFLVALARSGRQLIVETHSDHLVRRLRRLIARTEPGSESERWLLENVNIVEVDQSAEGVTYLHQATLTREGWIEKWPADFMDEAADEERAIHFAGLEKSPPEPPPAEEGIFEDVAPGDGRS